MRLTMDVSLRCETGAAGQARYLLDALLRMSGVAEDCRTQLGWLITEACTNAVVHADQADPVEVSVYIDDRTCVFDVGNHGGRLPDGLPADMPDPLAEGGRGLPLMRALADSAGFTRPRPGWVLLRIMKRLVFDQRLPADDRKVGSRTPRS